jgi:oxygen-dependent protoporphyrinogen oxidase
MSTLIDALVRAVPEGSIRLNTRVLALHPNDDGVSLALPGGTERYDAAILALQAHSAAGLLAATDPGLATELSQIEYAGAAVVNFIFERSQINHAMDGIGAVVPAVERRRIIAFSFSSVKFDGRAPEGLAVVRVFMGGALAPEIASLPRDEQTRIALDELRELIGISGEPRFSYAASHAGAMPQYHVGHLQRVARIRELAARHQRLALCGNAFDGVGVPDCIRGANEAVRMVQRVATFHAP